jgi:hypothetical protein
MRPRMRRVQRWFNDCIVIFVCLDSQPEGYQLLRTSLCRYDSGYCFPYEMSSASSLRPMQAYWWMICFASMLSIVVKQATMSKELDFSTKAP